MSYTYDYPRPAVTADALLFEADAASFRLLLIKRAHPPFEGRWAIPGGFLDMDETLHDAARRELREETGLDVRSLRQFAAFGDPGRDPRCRTVSIAYLAVVPAGQCAPRASDDAAEARWFDLAALPPLAFDHDLVVRVALDHLRRHGAGGDPALDQLVQRRLQQLNP